MGFSNQNEARARAENEMKPRVTLVSDNLRAVFDPPSGDVIIEKLAKDSIGGEYWTFIDRLPATVQRGEIRVSNATHFAILGLLANGKKPV